MKLTNLFIKDLITSDAKLTFLVGAGCSTDPPSCLPIGKKMMKSVIEFTCTESEINKILGLDNLRFEQLVEIVRDHLDKDLKIIDCSRNIHKLDGSGSDSLFPIETAYSSDSDISRIDSWNRLRH